MSMYRSFQPDTAIALTSYKPIAYKAGAKSDPSRLYIVAQVCASEILQLCQNQVCCCSKSLRKETLKAACKAPGLLLSAFCFPRCDSEENCSQVCQRGTVEIDPWLQNALKTQVGTAFTAKTLHITKNNNPVSIRSCSNFAMGTVFITASLDFLKFKGCEMAFLHVQKLWK